MCFLFVFQRAGGEKEEEEIEFAVEGGPSWILNIYIPNVCVFGTPCM
jgi:hypothetical protein